MNAPSASFGNGRSGSRKAMAVFLLSWRRFRQSAERLDRIVQRTGFPLFSAFSESSGDSSRPENALTRQRLEEKSPFTAGRDQPTQSADDPSPAGGAAWGPTSV